MKRSVLIKQNDKQAFLASLNKRTKLNGFTLIELMIVVVVVGILAAVAYPSYREHIKKSRRADAQSALMAFAQAMERHRTKNFTYVGAADGSTGAPNIFPAQIPVDGNQKTYTLSATDLGVSTYTLTAKPIPGTSQDGDGDLTLDHLSQRTWDRDNDGVSAADRCWSRSC